jgi:hypothetical protein
MLKFTNIFPQGRFCNVLMQNIGLSVIGKKFNLKCQYDWNSKNGYSFTFDSYLSDNFIFYNEGRIFDGQSQYYSDDSLDNLLSKEEVSFPIEYEGYLQKSCLLYGEQKLLDSCIVKNDIEYHNQVFVHVRLGDQLMNTAGYNYYERVLDSINFEGGLISSDSPDNEIVKNLINRYNLTLYNNDNFQEVISIASKFDHRIVTGGSSGWIIGYLGNNDNVYYVKNDYPNHIKYWPTEMFNNPKWKGY